MSDTKTVGDTKTVRAQEIFETLKRRILSWEYPPGYRFTEEEIGKEFRVSRSPVREALRTLEESGLVVRAPYRGCTVKQPNLQEIHELYDVRLMLETAIVEQLAAHGIAPDVLERLSEPWRALERERHLKRVDGAQLAEQDRAFHETLAHATGNRTLGDLLGTINDRLHFVRMTDITTSERLRDTCQQHLLIVACIAAGDTGAAREAMRRNIDGARVHVESALKEVLMRAYLTPIERM